MPNALPSADIALTRKSGCAHRIARLIVGSTVCTIPTTPSGATTGLRRARRRCEPALSVIGEVVARVRAPVQRLAPGRSPTAACAPRPRSLRSRSFSALERRDAHRGERERVAPQLVALGREIGTRAPALGAALEPTRAARRASGAAPPATGSRRLGGSTIDDEREQDAAAEERRCRSGYREPGSRGPPATSGAQDRPVLLLVVENPAGAAHDAGQRILVDVDRQARSPG